ncbi:MAG: cysteine--tRNA ligase [Dehalococcoidia bacterium]|nr:cysteine--tRNA ligase [Dehalococcoidia bacterium]
MRLANTLTGCVEELRPLQPGRVGIYVCGVTPYAESHIGHAMSAIVYDVLVRYLRWRGNPAGGYGVTYVTNYTDVDDKIIERARELGVDPRALADQNIAQWEAEQAALNLTPPDQRPRVSGEIGGPQGIVALIERIIARGYAYPTAQGDVYFRVRSKADYGKLSHRNIEQLRSGTRFEPGEEKEFALDFALWKAAKPEEPASVRWPSPWGDGRPGWHIECSAMAQRYLGDTSGAFDIHGGGLDLVFPHHENEIAQSEAAGAGFARLWLHNGLVQRDGEKMSKSLGNVVSVREALEVKRWSPDALRLFALSSHYRSPNNLTDEAMAAAEAGVERLRRAASREPLLGAELSSSTPLNVLDVPAERERDFVAAMKDDLNTPRALAALFGLANAINQGIDEHQGPEYVRSMQEKLSGLARDVLGLALEGPAPAAALNVAALAKLAARLEVACGGKDGAGTVEALLEHREAARRERDFALADRIRDGLAALGVAIEDTPQGPRWSARG